MSAPFVQVFTFSSALKKDILFHQPYKMADNHGIQAPFPE
jgi:hypothetical protein